MNYHIASILHCKRFTATLNNSATLIPFYYQTGLKTLTMILEVYLYHSLLNVA